MADIDFTKTDFPAGTSPFSVTAGDFNGDGLQDLAVANADSDDVSVLLADGSGGFGTATNFAAGTTPVSVAAGDFNADGVQDLAVANSGSDDISILFGDGFGGFDIPSNFAAGTTPNSVVVGDFDGNGVQDLAVANGGSSDVSVLLGDGNGSFDIPSSYTAGTIPTDVEVGDFNGDELEDLVVVNSGSDDISILFADGFGGFDIPTNFTVGTFPTDVAVGDFNADEVKDLAVANFDSGDVSVLLGDGFGGFDISNNFTVGDNPSSVKVGDFNADGLQDLAVANFGSNSVSVLLGDGTGSFDIPTDFTVGEAPNSVTVGDFDGNGVQDLAVANSISNDVSVLLNNATPPTPVPTVSIVADIDSIDENAGDIGSYTITRTDITGEFTFPGELTVNFSLDDDDSAADYELSVDGEVLSGNSVTFADGQETIEITLTPIDDIAAEDDEEVTLSLAEDDAYAIDSADDDATITIVANDTVVTNTEDSGEGSLRQAIENANAIFGEDIVSFDIEGEFATPQTISLTSGELIVTDDVTISGTGSNNLTVSGSDHFRVFNIDDGDGFAGKLVTIDGLKITGGNADNGSGIYNAEALTLTNSTISGNSATGDGAGIYNNGGTLSITSSTISGNAAAGNGGGISNLNATLDLINSTISGNAAANNGGGIYNDGTATIAATNATIAFNIADTDGNNFGNGGGIYNDGTATINNTIVGSNSDNSPVGGTKNDDLKGDFTGGTHNLIGKDTGSTGLVNGEFGNIVGNSTRAINPKLGVLANNGGSTQTHALLPGSRAINNGSMDIVTEFTDQRGEGFDRIDLITGRVDIGAYEEQNPFPAVSVTANTPSVREGSNGSYTVSRNYADGDLIVTLTRNGTAQYNTRLGRQDDYTLSGTGVTFSGNRVSVLIPEGETDVIINFSARRDSVNEPNETAILTVQQNPNYLIDTGESSATITIPGTTPTALRSSTPASQSVNPLQMNSSVFDTVNNLIASNPLFA